MRTRTWVAGLIVTAVLAYVLVPMAGKLVGLKGQKSGLADDIRRLESKTNLLENELRLLKDDPVYIEYIARKTFRKVKEGEVIYKFVPSRETTTSGA